MEHLHSYRDGYSYSKRSKVFRRVIKESLTTLISIILTNDHQGSLIVFGGGVVLEKWINCWLFLLLTTQVLLAPEGIDVVMQFAKLHLVED